MDQDIVFLEHGLDISMSLIKVRVDAFVLVVLQVDPFAMFNHSLLYLFLNAVVVVGPLVNNAQHAVDFQVSNKIRLVKDIYTTQVEVALMIWRVLLILEDVYYMAAILVVVHCVQERIII